MEMDADGQSGYVGSKVELRCVFINTVPPVKISQVTWQKLVNGTKQNVAIANPTLGVSVAPPFRERVRFKNAGVRRRSPSLEDTTITFSSLRLLDDATYICEYTTFPAGNRENTVNLTVLTRPTSKVSLSTPTLVARSSTMKTPVATCILANGKPAGTIRWDTRVPGEARTQEMRNDDGTVTVQSDYILVPSREMHEERLTCITSYNGEIYSDSVTLDVQYEPDVVVEGYDGNWYLNREDVQLTCQADANPPVSLFQWKLLNGSIPESIEVRDNILVFRGPITYELAGTYVCDATNSIGTQSVSVEVNIAEKPRPLVAPGDIINVVCLLLAGGLTLGTAITVLALKLRMQCSKKNRDPISSSLSPKMTPPAAMNRPGDENQCSGKFYEEVSNPTDYRVSYRLACSQEDLPHQYSPPNNTPLSFLPQHPYAPSQPTATRSPSNATSSPSNATPNNTFSPASRSSSIFRYPSQPAPSPPSGATPYTFPKEQYV